jgi:hypothetical protein
MPSGFVDVHTAAKILGLSTRRIHQLFKAGRFETAHQITGHRGWWRVSRHELLARKMSQQEQYKNYE